MKRPALIVSLPYIVSAILLAVSPAYASSQQDILGDSTVASRVNFPPVTAGAGYILPDNPLYFLDKLVQHVRVATAVTPEQRSRVRLQIEGERLAELRIMMARDNDDGIASTLHDMAKEAALASKELSDATARGKNVSALAKDINDTLSLHREMLASVVEQTDGSLAMQLDAAREELLVAKLQAADSLSEEDFVLAFEADLEAELDSHVLGVTTTANKLDKRIDQFEKNVILRETKEASKEALKLRQEELKAAKDKKLQTLLQRKKKIQEELKKKQEKARELRKKKLEEAREAAKKAREAAARFKEARQAQKDSQAGESNTTEDGSSSSNTSSSTD